MIVYPQHKRNDNTMQGGPEGGGGSGCSMVWVPDSLLQTSAVSSERNFDLELSIVAAALGWWKVKTSCVSARGVKRWSFTTYGVSKCFRSS